MKSVNRREFVKGITISSATFLPGVNAIAGFFQSALNAPVDPNQFITAQFRLIDTSRMLNVELYFINAIPTKIGNKNYLVRKSNLGGQEAYMIVRLPQQHIAEQYISSRKLSGASPFFAICYISGYSYLVFKILYHENLAFQRLELTTQSLLNWNDSKQFELVVRQNLESSFFEIVSEGALPSASDDINDQKFENHYPLGYHNDGSLKFGAGYFPKVGSELNDDRSKKVSDPSPVTAIEAPYKLILSPTLPDQSRKYRFRWTFSQLPNKKSTCEGTEIWMATLRTEKVRYKENKQKIDKPAINASTDLPEEVDNKGNSDLRLMMIGSPDYKASTGSISPDQCNDEKALLPDATDRRDLVDLYIQYKLKARTPKISFTPLGICTDIEFKNKHYERTLEKGNSLYEWKQSISFGRDQKTEVSRVVIEACFGLKMLHIKKAKRETYKGASVLVYREFLMPLELEKDYTLYNNNDNIDQYSNGNWKCNSPFKKVQFAETAPKQIMIIEEMIAEAKDYIVFENDATSCNNHVLAFWPLTKTGQFIEWPFKVTDWHDNTHICKKKLFIYTSVLADVNRKDVYTLPADFEKEVEKTIFKPVTAAQDFIKIEKDVKDALQAEISKTHGTWVKLLDLSEQFALKKIDYYTVYLEKVLGEAETKIRRAAGAIEDKGMEEWAIFKRKVLEEEPKLLRTVDSFLNYLEQRKAIPAIDIIIKRVKAQRESILANIRAQGKDLITLANNIVVSLKRDVQSALAAISTDATKELSDQFEKINNQLEDLTSALKIGFELEYREFLEKLPARLRNDIKNSLAKDINNLNQVVNRIRTLEADVKTRIDFYKASIGYAVYQVDEELEKIKEELKKAFNGKWEEEYIKIKEKYHKEVNASLSELQTRYMILKGNVRHTMRTVSENVEKRVFDFFNEYACFPQLHSATVYVKSVNDIVNKEIPCKIKYAEDYVKNQVNNVILDTKNNVSRVFVEFKADAKEYVKSAMREVNKELGGIINPDLAADYLTYLKDTRKKAEVVAGKILDRATEVEAELKQSAESVKEQIRNLGSELKDEINRNYRDSALEELRKQVEQTVNEARNSVTLIGKQAKEQFEQYRDLAKMEGKQFFQGLEAKILGAIHLKDIIGVGFELPKMDRANNTVYYRFITDKIQPVKIGPFSFENTSKVKASSLMVYMEKPLSNASAYKAWTSLNDFRVGIFESRVIVEFTKLQIYSDQNTRNKVSVKISDVQFTQELAFLQALSRNIKIPGTGLSLSILPQEISIDFAYSVPGISGGAFTFDNLKFGVGIYIPLPIGSREGQMPVTAKFAINGPDDKFVVATGIWGGKGHFVLEATPKYIKRIDAGIDFGGYLALNLGIAKGEAFLMAGIRYVYFRDDIGEVGFELYATLSCGGSVTVFGFITLSVVFLLCLKYQKYQGRTTLYGTASVTYSVKIGFFRKSFSLTFSRRLHGSEGGQQTGEVGYKSWPYPNSELRDVAMRQSGPNAEYIDYEEVSDNGSIYDSEDKPKSPTQSFNGEQWFRMINTYKLYKQN